MRMRFLVLVLAVGNDGSSRTRRSCIDALGILRGPLRTQRTQANGKRERLTIGT